MQKVAPLVGAWIEIMQNYKKYAIPPVAPLVGAWIEMISRLGGVASGRVAPLVGAWIEIPISYITSYAVTCRSPRGSVD